jgi:hypothetical protein
MLFNKEDKLFKSNTLRNICNLKCTGHTGHLLNSYTFIIYKNIIPVFQTNIVDFVELIQKITFIAQTNFANKASRCLVKAAIRNGYFNQVDWNEFVTEIRNDEALNRYGESDDEEDYSFQYFNQVTL